MKIIDVKIGSDEWKNLRMNSISATDSAVILGISPWKDKAHLALEKKGLYSSPLNWAMKRGLDNEHIGIEWAQIEFWCTLEPLTIKSENYPWKIATLDGINLEKEILVEIKWPNAKVHHMAQQRKVIDYYYAQCQSQLYCSGYKRMYFISCRDYFGETEFACVPVEYDEEYIEKLLEEEQKFYEENVELVL